jgi:hypothetical protein
MTVMRGPIVIALCVPLLVGGCVNYRASKVVALVGAAGLATTLVVGAVRPEPRGDVDVGGFYLEMSLLAGLGVAVAGVIGMAIHHPRSSATPTASASK